MYNVLDFIRWALLHVSPASVPDGALFAADQPNIGIEPWQYLFGSIMVRTTDAILARYYDTYYHKVMTRAEYDGITSGWSRTGYATDCQGLLDAWLTYEKDDATDINADGNYRLWCTEKSPIGDTVRPFVPGEAVFRADSTGRMTHVGWICGSLYGEPLVVEARSIRYGVVISRLYSRDFTHRGLMTRKFSYGGEEIMPVKLELTSPMMRGDEILALQFALNRLGYRGIGGEPLSEDGKLGRNTLFAIDEFVKVQSDLTPPVFSLLGEGGGYSLKILVERNE